MSTKLRRTVVRGLAVAAAGAVVAALGVACGGAGFDPKSKVDSVRLFAARADKLYAKPGETVSLEVLAFDGRAKPARPMRHYFLPFVCLNPPADQYFGCFLPGVLASPDGGVPSRGWRGFLIDFFMIAPCEGSGGSRARRTHRRRRRRECSRVQVRPASVESWGVH